MYNTHLRELLIRFTPYEMNSFEKFIISPYFNKNTNIIKLFTILKKAYPDFKAHIIDKKAVYQKIYPAKTYDDKQMRYLTYELLKLAGKFLGLENYYKNSFTPSADTCEAILDKGYLLLGEKLLKKTEVQLNTCHSNSILFYNEYIVARKKNFINLYMKQTPYDSKNEDPGEPAAMFFLDVLTASIYELNTNKNAYNKELHGIIPEFMNYFDLKGFTEKIMLSSLKYGRLTEMYYRMVNMICFPEQTLFYYETISDLGYYLNHLRKYNMLNLVTLLQAYCIEKITSGKDEFYNERFKLTKFIIKNNLHRYEDMLHFDYVRFHNFFISAIDVKQYKWAGEFITKYSNELDPKLKYEVVNYCRAVLSFNVKDYDNALFSVSRSNPDDVRFKMGVRELTLMIYYERQQFESALTAIDSYKHFLKREKSLSSSRKLNVYNFINFACELVKIKLSPEKYSPVDKDKLAEKIKMASGLTQKVWLTEKTKALT